MEPELKQAVAVAASRSGLDVETFLEEAIKAFTAWVLEAEEKDPEVSESLGVLYALGVVSLDEA